MLVNSGWRTGRLTSLWTAAGFFYIIIVIELSAFVQTVNHHLM